MGAIYDFWLGEELSRPTRARKRRRRDGFCHDCQSSVQAGHSRCAFHMQRERENQARYRERRTRLKKRSAMESSAHDVRPVMISGL
jgi:hypothetical protein